MKNRKKLEPAANLFRVGLGEVYYIAEEELPKDSFWGLKPTFLTLKSVFEGNRNAINLRKSEFNFTDAEWSSEDSCLKVRFDKPVQKAYVSSYSG